MSSPNHFLSVESLPYTEINRKVPGVLVSLDCTESHVRHWLTVEDEMFAVNVMVCRLCEKVRERERERNTVLMMIVC